MIAETLRPPIENFTVYLTQITSHCVSKMQNAVGDCSRPFLDLSSSSNMDFLQLHAWYQVV